MLQVSKSLIHIVCIAAFILFMLLLVIIVYLVWRNEERKEGEGRQNKTKEINNELYYIKPNNRLKSSLFYSYFLSFSPYFKKKKKSSYTCCTWHNILHNIFRCKLKMIISIYYLSINYWPNGIILLTMIRKMPVNMIKKTRT